MTKMMWAAMAALGLLAGSACGAPRPAGYTTTLPVRNAVPAPQIRKRPDPTILPSWTYSVTASPDLYGGTYSGEIIGSSPFAATKKSAIVQLQIVPLVVTINDGTTTQVYDPTKPDACDGNRSAVWSTRHSPLFRPLPWTINGVGVGNVQYIDAFQRAQFWSLVQGTDFHLKFANSLLPAQPQIFSGAANGVNYNAATMWGGCGWLGVVNQNDLDARVQSLITGPLAKMVDAGTFPVFLLRNVVTSSTGVLLVTCCSLGYHSGLMVGGNLQIYSPVEYDTTGVFGSGSTLITDVEILSHELAEAVNDPTINNLTPMWGNIGQLRPGCEGALEVADPLTPGTTPANTYVVKGYGGKMYHLQELAFFSWFYGGASLGAGGLYSDNGSFRGDAIPCNAGGGTN